MINIDKVKPEAERAYVGLMMGVVLPKPCGELVARGRDAGVLLIVSAENRIRLLPPLIINAEEADLLEVPHSSPLLAIESCALSESGRPIEYYYALFRTDLASLHVRIG